MSYLSAIPSIILGQKIYLYGKEEFAFEYIATSEEGDLYLHSYEGNRIDHKYYLRDTNEDGDFFGMIVDDTPNKSILDHSYKESLVGTRVYITDLTDYEGSFPKEEIENSTAYSVEEEGETWVRINGCKISKKRVIKSSSYSERLKEYLRPGSIFTTANSLYKETNNLFIYKGGERCRKLIPNVNGELQESEDSYGINFAGADFRIISSKGSYDSRLIVREREDIEFINEHLLGSSVYSNPYPSSVIGREVSSISPTSKGVSISPDQYHFIDNGEYSSRVGNSTITSSISTQPSEFYKIKKKLESYYSSELSKFRIFGFQNVNYPDWESIDYTAIQKSLVTLGDLSEDVDSIITRIRILDCLGPNTNTNLITLEHYNCKHSRNSISSPHVVSRVIAEPILSNKRDLINSYKNIFLPYEERSNRDYSLAPVLEFLVKKGLITHSTYRNDLEQLENMLSRNPNSDDPNTANLENLGGTISERSEFVTTDNSSRLSGFKSQSKKSPRKNIKKGDKVRCKNPKENSNLEKNEIYKVESVKRVNNKVLVKIESERGKILSSIKNFKKVKNE